jgi:hypothetical protein
MGDKVDQAALLSLRNKYGDEELVHKIHAAFQETHARVVKHAKKFAQAVRQKYSNSNVPYHQLLLKARLHAKKYNLTESQFAEFQRIYEQELAGTGRANEVVLPVTNMMRVMGNITGDGSTTGFNIAEGDYRNLQEILKLHEASRSLHAQIVLQSLQYRDPVITPPNAPGPAGNAPRFIRPAPRAGANNNSVEAISGTFDASKHNPGEHVHPIVAAMFLPKVRVLESHFLYSNMSGLVKSLYNREALTTRPDYELYYNLITDPNDIVCDNRTPVGDLLQRCNLQNQLWNAVLHLRNGQYYNSSFREFMTAVDVCRINKHDNPDLVYGRHDGTIVKRILAAFSFRPTVVATAPVSSIFNNNPYANNVRPTVTQIPMINVRLLSFQTSNVVNVAGPQPKNYVNLEDAMNQVQTFIEGNVLVNRATDVIYSREVMFFYVDRRAHLMNLGMKMFNLANLPTSVAGFERINTKRIGVPCSLNVRGDSFDLRSVVCAKTIQDTQNPNSQTSLVTGSETVFLECGGATMPQGAMGPVANNIGSDIGTRANSLNNLVYNPADANKNGGNVFSYSVNVLNAIETRGVVFMYQNMNANDELNPRVTL